MKLTKCDLTVVLATTWQTYIYTKTPLHSGYYNIQCLKNVENQLRFHKVAESLKVGTFFETQCTQTPTVVRMRIIMCHNGTF